MDSLELKVNGELTLKNAQLADSAATIAAVYDKASKMARDTVVKIAKELGKVQKSKSYEEDGFKSAADFAERYCGMKHSTAYNFAAWGRALLEPDCPQAVKDMSPANYAEVKALGYDAVKNAVEAGEIRADMTQDELAAYRKEHSDKPAKTTVLKRYNVSIPMLKRDVENVTEADIDDVFDEQSDTPISYDVLKAKALDGEAMRKVYVTPGGLAYVAIFYAITENTTKAAKGKSADYKRAAAMVHAGLDIETINGILGTKYGARDYDAMLAGPDPRDANK